MQSVVMEFDDPVFSLNAHDQGVVGVDPDGWSVGGHPRPAPTTASLLLGEIVGARGPGPMRNRTTLVLR
jgi:hypothetical protein